MSIARNFVKFHAINNFVLSFAMVCTLLAGVNVVAFAADSDDSLTDTVSVLRAYNPNNGEHLMTVDETEYNANVARGYSAEGEKWKAPLESKSPVYRVYNPNSGEHLLLATEAEYNATVAAGWEGEGVKMYSDDNKGVPIYRLFNPNAHDAGSHHYCEKEEADGLVAIGWKWDLNGEPAIYGVKGEEPQVVVNLTDAKQLSANTIEVKFDQAATGLVAKEDIDVSKADGTLTIPVNNMTLSDDGMSAVLELAVALQDKTDYAVSLNESVSTFTASVGEVASVALKTTTAQQNVETPIEFALFDATGVDVTSTVNVDATCSVVVEGTVTSNTSKASKSTITMDTVDDKATVTITYNAGELESKDVTTQGVITCVEPEAEVGMGIYADQDPEDPTYINAESQCAKFYWGEAVIKTSAVTVEVNESNDGIYFCAAKAIDPDGVIAYDSYKVESSNEDVMSVTSDVDSGKFARMTVSGNAVGSANIVITATKNGKDTTYTIPVTVTKTGVLNSVNFTVTRSKLTNAIDDDYSGLATAYGVDSNNNRVYDADVTFSVVDYDKKGGNNKDIEDNYFNALSGKGLIAKGESGFRVDGGETAEGPIATYTAWNAQGGSRTLKATVSMDDIVKEKSTSISVDALPEGIWNNGAADRTDAKLTYNVELSNATLTQPASSTTTARLAAYYGGKFVGYVRQLNDGSTMIGTPDVLAAGDKATATLYEITDPDDPEGSVTGKTVKIEAKNAGSEYNNYGVAFVPSEDTTDVSTGSSITVTDISGIKILTFNFGWGTVVGGTYQQDWDALVETYRTGTAAQKAIYKEAIKFNVDNNTTGPQAIPPAAFVAGIAFTDGGTDFKTSTVNVDATTKLSEVTVGVKYGAKYATPYMAGTGIFMLTNSAENIQADKPVEELSEDGSIIILSVVPSNDGKMMFVSGDSKFDQNFAKPGAYTVEYRYKIGTDDGETPVDERKDSKSTTSLSVKNGLTPMVPTVNVKDRNVDSLDESTIIENMATMVDLNNNTSSHESIKGLYTIKDGALAPIEAGESSVNVKYAEVVDNFAGFTVSFYVPINKTFYLS